MGKPSVGDPCLLNGLPERFLTKLGVPFGSRIGADVGQVLDGEGPEEAGECRSGSGAVSNGVKRWLVSLHSFSVAQLVALACIMHEPPATTADMAVLPGVLGSRTLPRTDKYASGPVPRCRGMVARWHDHLHALATASRA